MADATRRQQPAIADGDVDNEVSVSLLAELQHIQMSESTALEDVILKQVGLCTNFSLSEFHFQLAVKLEILGVCHKIIYEQ